MKRLFNSPRAKVVLAALALLILAPGASAQEFLKKYAAPMPTITFMPEAEFNAQTNLYQETPAGDEALSYKFRLPKEWKKPEDSATTTYQISNKILGEIVRFYGPPIIDSRSYFSMQAINLEYQLTAQQWLLQYLLSNGYTIQGIKEHDKKRAEALYVKVEQGVTYVIRAIAQVNGKRIVMAQYFMPADNWEAEKQLQAQVMSTFELTHPIHEYVEEMTKYHFLDIAEFQYPVSWEFKPAPLKNADRMSFELLNIASEQRIDWKNYKTLNGRVQVDIISYDSMESAEEEVEKLKEGLSKVQLVAGSKLEEISSFKYDSQVEATPVEVYTALDSESSMLKYEYWVVALKSGEYYYFVSLVTPSRDEDYFIWARNTQAYEQILELFQPLDEGLIYR